MRKLILGMSRPKTWKPFAKLIMWADETDYSHAFTAFESRSWDCHFIYQNSEHRTNFMGGSLFYTKNETARIYELEVSEEIYNKVGKLCVEREGKPYGVKQVIFKALSKAIFIGSAGHVRVKTFFPNGDAETDCIEEQAYLLAQGVGIEVPVDLDTISVKPYVEFLEKIPGIKRVK